MAIVGSLSKSMVKLGSDGSAYAATPSPISSTKDTKSAAKRESHNAFRWSNRSRADDTFSIEATDPVNNEVVCVSPMPRRKVWRAQP
jgi:hypothetical protein